ncbi:hypothetical protein SPRG_01547 [Saprolegnia parasitica CBS 223.65]|uniref:Uncharacterized protein n=1 Tax=Saprolegnia parasitica (strain CBS 223.65) TaxID=695850 RepID=A0A067D6T6_SAPPC|nr:hypothetical protein SPRG_01547 [Saprolegnia parasitica CBS 223.65]KDO34411.1 hypothetical protein SPRG_01547 [Saprolegnia parasitica CBS 223.65]|eukprot:XP_012195145.1 hypothetical protein SPRG_01547 [Saprolegnia parasitica CBS 223.65]
MRAFCPDAVLYAKHFSIATINANKKFATGHRPPEDAAARPGQVQSFGLGNLMNSASEKAVLLQNLRWQRETLFVLAGNAVAGVVA